MWSEKSKDVTRLQQFAKNKPKRLFSFQDCQLSSMEYKATIFG